MTIRISKVAKAIKLINPDAEFRGMDNDLNSLEWLNNTAPISKEDIEAKILEIENEEADAVNKKASGKQKLLDLGLTEDEVKALIGI